jgi:redox-sensitive bicupin YhaK (pirin superfamily)
VRLLDVTLADAAALAVSVAAGHTAFLLPIAGSVIVDGETLSSGGSPVPVWGPSPQSHVIRLQASGAGAQVAVFSGEPLDQPVHWQGPMALASPEALAQAMAAYRRGEFGHL